MSTSPAASTPPSMEIPPIAPASDRVFTLNAARIRTWGWKSFLALLDQGLTSGAGFLVNLLLARWLMPASYGAFAVAFAAFLFVSGFHNVLLLEPLTVIGSGRHSRRLPAYFRAQLAIHFALVGALALVGLLGGLILWRLQPGSPLVGAIFGSALMLPLLLLLWLIRRMCYVLHRPGTAVAGSAAYFFLITAGLAALRHLDWATPFFAFLLMGISSLVAAAVLLPRFGFSRWVQLNASCSWRSVLLENWTYGRWLMGSAVLYSVSSQMQMFLVAGIVGLGTAGVLRAMQLPSLIMTQVITAAGLLFLPVFSRDFGKGLITNMRRNALLLNIGMCLTAVLFASFLTLGSHRSEQLLFGGKYAAFAWLMPVLALVPVASGASTGYSMALRASGRPHFDLISNVIAAPISVLSALLFVRWWGLVGAAASMVLSFTIMSIVTIAFFQTSKWNEA